MILSIEHKGLRLLWQKNDASKLPAEQLEKIRRVLAALNAATTVEVFRAIPGYRLHQLSGKLKGYWSITITGNYRIIFRFENENAYLLDYLDYH